MLDLNIESELLNDVSLFEEYILNCIGVYRFNIFLTIWYLKTIYK
jgi:hypothetical protein